MIAVSNLHELADDRWFAGVDDSSQSESGVLSFKSESKPVGSVLVDRGRVCWAFGPTPSLDRFISNVVDHSPLSAAALRSLLVRCRSQRLPLWDTLLNEQALSDAILRDAVKDHCVDAFMQIDAAKPTERQWKPRAPLRARYGLPMIELVSEVATRRVPDAAAAVCQEVEKLAARGVSAMAFVDGLPYCPKGLSLSWTEVMELYGWATGFLEAAKAAVHNGRALITRSDQGFVLLAPRDRVLYLALGEPQLLGRAVSALSDALVDATHAPR